MFRVRGANVFIKETKNSSQLRGGKSIFGEIGEMESCSFYEMHNLSFP